jgi:S-(hydroxymethyl)glutathione dehydrogenase/alcohol dehydrogenase
MRALTMRGIDDCSIEDLALRPLGRSDVLLSIDASGICHSDVAVLDGTLAGRLPVVLGHEGTGTVLEVGTDVSRAKVGDRVVLSAIPSCGHCYFCSRREPYNCERAGAIRKPPFLDGDQPIAGTSGLGTFAETLVVDEQTVVPVHTDLPAEQLSLLGCAILTGVGAALNIAEVEAGDSVLVIGAGGIGLAAIQGARAQGAVPIVAIDPAEGARTAALVSGATHAFGLDDDAPAALRDLTRGRGFDVVIECVGRSSSFEMGWKHTRQGGEIVLVGVAPRDEANPIPLLDHVLSGRRVTGCVYGQASIHRDIPRFVAMAESGRLDFASMIGRTITLDAAPDVLRGQSPHPGRTVIANG